MEVRDTGIGMDEETRRRCLEPFFTTKGERGTGLGLAMVYGMAQRHSADIEIDSAPGKGTCVRLAFRAADAVAAGGGTRAAAIVPHGLRHPASWTTIRCCCARCARSSSRRATPCVAASGGQQGIDLATRGAGTRASTFSVAFTDLGMPHVDGRQVARALKAWSPQLPVILLTGWGQRLRQ